MTTVTASCAVERLLADETKTIVFLFLQQLHIFHNMVFLFRASVSLFFAIIFLISHHKLQCFCNHIPTAIWCFCFVLMFLFLPLSHSICGAVIHQSVALLTFTTSPHHHHHHHHLRHYHHHHHHHRRRYISCQCVARSSRLPFPHSHGIVRCISAKLKKAQDRQSQASSNL